jgi:hypothetical protein
MHNKARTPQLFTSVTMATSATVPMPTDAAPGPIYIDTQHEDIVHDAQMDFYGSKLATCSSGKTNVFDSIRSQSRVPLGVSVALAI